MQCERQILLRYFFNGVHYNVWFINGFIASFSCKQVILIKKCYNTDT